MTGLGSGAPGRETMTDEAPRRGIGPGILPILAIGLIFRLIMAYAIDPLRGSGFESDLGLFRYWAEILAEHGPPGFYEQASYADYTPGYLYALWLVGLAGQVLGGVGDLIKLPAILTDVAMAWVVHAMVLDLGAGRRRALLAAAVVVVNPITWFDSVIWGQVDSFGVVFLLLAIRELWRGRTERSAILAMVAGLVKPQLLILVPIVAAVTIRRALRPKGGWGEEPPPAPSGTAWERRTGGPVRILTTGAAGFLTAVALSLPFGLSVVSLSPAAPFLDSSLVRLMLSTAAVYPYLTVNAYNAWALFPVNGESMATGGGATWIPDSPIPDAAAWGAIGPLPAAAVGAVLLLSTAAIVALAVARRPDRLGILVGACVLALAFFALPTRVHERYLFPLFGLAAILFAFSWRWRIAYVAAGLATFLNMYVVLTTLYPDNPGVSDWLGIGGAIRSTAGVTLVAVLHTAAFAWAFAQLRPGARAALREELADAREEAVLEEGEEATAGHPRRAGPERASAALAVPPGGMAARPAGDGGQPAAGSAGSLAGAPDGSQAAAASPRLVPAWLERPSWTELGPVGWLRARMRETPIRPDRSAELRLERPGRVDRLDLWILLVLVVAALVLRTYRLGEPPRMHFDEVYHARTAAEFLQGWRYGISHSIYEWTHPHLAKYAMAGGIALFAGRDVEATSDLGVPVRDAAIEPRRESAAGGDRAGDRAWVVTGSELVAFDLEDRSAAGRWPLPGGSAVAFDPVALQVLVGTDGGQLLSLDTGPLDVDRGDGGPPPVQPELVVTLDGPVRQLAPFDDGISVGVLLPDDTVAVVDAGFGAELGRVRVPGAADLAQVGSGDGLVAIPVNVPDADEAAEILAGITGRDPEVLRPGLGATDAERVILDVELTADVRSDLAAAIEDGRLVGVAIDQVAMLGVAGSEGLAFVTPAGTLAARVAAAGATSLALVTDVEDGSQVYATTTDATTGRPEITVVAVSGDAAEDGPEVSTSFALPGQGSRVVFDPASRLVEVLGTAPDGTGTTVYVVEPHGKSVFADHRLPFAPSAWALDHVPDYPGQTRGQLLAFSAEGRGAAMDVGGYHFSWRLPGVVLGVLTLAVLFLLARVLFRRRAVAVLVGLFVLFDGMFFVQSRIAMNDVYTGAFILSAYLLFAWLWIDRRPRWAFWTVMPVVGVLLGLALASKWVAAYAIGALGILVLARSALGRLLLIAGLAGLAAVLGWMALAVPAEGGGSGNLLFTLIMIGLTLAAVAISVYRPIAWSDDEIRLAVGGPAVAGIGLALASIALGVSGRSLALGPVLVTPLHAAFALVLLGGLAYAAFGLAGRLGFGPMAAGPAFASPEEEGADEPSGRAVVGDAGRAAPPPAEGWLRPGSGLGLPLAWLLGSLVVVPLAVYVASYVPWALIENHRLWEGWPASHTGETLLQLTGRMYGYHNELTAAHAASSPWWAWPLNLKPVWFYQGSFAGSTAASIYDAGNMVTWWMGVPAMAFVAYQAFRRRSLALALILVAFLAQWISWARIDRASFQYHWYTSLPFVMLALGYFVAELWHGASRRTWWLARVAAAVALLGPVLLWLLRLPLCGLAGVESVNQGSQACNGNPGNLVITPAALGLVAVILVTLVVLGRLLLDLARPRADGRPLAVRDLAPLVAAALAGGAGLALTRLLPDQDPLLSFPGIVPELIALAIALPLLLVAVQVLTARDGRRFVVGLVAAAAAWFAVLYPNIAALPLPSTVVNAYQGLLPTYLYAFQFSVSTVDRRGATSFADPAFAILLVAIVVSCLVVAYSAWAWRQALEEDVAGTGA